MTDVPNPNPPPADGNWTTGLAPELVGHAQNKGWDKLPVADAAKAALTAHREAQTYIGVPAERLVRLPEANAAPEAWNPVWERLGRPKTAAEYDFAAVKRADGTAPDAQFIEQVRKEAFARGLSKQGAIDHAKAWVGWVESEDAREQATAKAEATIARQKLADNWGKDTEFRTARAKRIAELAGFTVEEIAALESTKGYAHVMNLMDKIAEKAGEQTFIGNGRGSANPTSMTKEQAIAKKAELMGDSEWRKRYLDGGAAENREFQALIAVEVGTGT